MSAVSALRAVLREALAQVAANVAGAAAGDNAEYLHQLRVGARRLRSALRASRDLWRQDDVHALHQGLKRLARATGPARDWDVVVPRLPPRLRAGARGRQRRAHAVLRGALRAPADWTVPRARRTAPLQLLPGYARTVLARLDAKALRAGARIDWSSADARHALRIRLRRLRYLAQPLQGAFPRADSRPLLASLEDLQDILGKLNDLEVGRRLMAELGARLARQQARERKQIARLPAAWRRFSAAPRFWRKIGL